MFLPAMTPTAHDPYAALRTPAFRWFLGSVVALTLGTQVQGVVVAWQVYAATKDPLSLGLIGLAEALPYIAITLPAGHLADVHDRKRIASLAMLALLGCALALLALTLAVPRIGTREVVLIYAVTAVGGIARGFLLPARTALTQQLIPREALANAVSWRSAVWQFSATAGPALGGALIGLGGPRLAYGTDVALLVAGALAFALVPRVARSAAAPSGPMLAGLREGLAHVGNDRVLLGALTLDLFAVLFGGATALLPVFAQEILHVGPGGFGMLRAAPALGAAVMSVALAHRPPIARAGRALFLCVALFGVSMIGFGLSRRFELSLGLLAFGGMVDYVSVVIRATLLQVRTPERLLGRVSAVNGIFIGSSNEIGAFESGVAARLLGTVPSVVVGGVLTLAVVAAAAWRIPELRRLGRLT